MPGTPPFGRRRPGAATGAAYRGSGAAHEGQGVPMAYMVQRGGEGQSPLMTTREVCEVLGVSRWTLARLVRDAKLERLDLGPRSGRYRADDVMGLVGSVGRPRNAESPPPAGGGGLS